MIRTARRIQSDRLGVGGNSRNSVNFQSVDGPVLVVLARISGIEEAPSCEGRGLLNERSESRLPVVRLDLTPGVILCRHRRARIRITDLIRDPEIVIRDLHALILGQLGDGLT